MKADVTLADVAARVGMSHMSVSRALRGAPGVSQATIARIKAVVKEMGYDPALNHAARKMAMKRHDQTVLNQVVALFFPSDFPASAYFVRLYLGVLAEVEEHQFGLLTHYTSLLWESPALPPLFMRNEVDGAITLLTGPNPGPFVQQLRQHTPFADRPIVTLIEPVPGCSAVISDDYQGGYLAASHLLALGHRHLLHSTYHDYPFQQRLRGYQYAYAEHGMEAAPHLHACVWDNEGATPPATVFIEFLRRHPEITGVLAPNDFIGLQMHQALCEAGIPVPDRISLVGYDDAVPLFNSQGENVLTTVALPLETMGREAVRLLVHRITGQEASNRQIVLPVTLVPRLTTAQAPAVG